MECNKKAPRTTLNREMVMQSVAQVNNFYHIKLMDLT